LDSDPGPLTLQLIVAFVLLLLNGFFVAAEFAMVKVRSSRIDAFALERSIRAKFARSVVSNLNSYLSACQLGITLTSLGLGWLGAATVTGMLEPLLQNMNVPGSIIHAIAFVIGFTIIAAFHVTIGKQIPKTYAIRKSEQVVLWSAAPMMLFYKLMYPLIWCLNETSHWMLRKSGIEPETEHEAVHTEEEIRVLVKESHKNGYIGNTELTLVDNVFEFTETVAREVMIPRTEMACLYANLSFDENLEIAISAMRTRYPVCDPDKDNMIGFVHIKDLLKNAREGLDDIRTIARPLMSVPETIPISTLLEQMQKKRTEIALLIDEYGGTSGLVTVEDILEELVGEIHDEFDRERPSIEQKDANTHSVDGLLHIDEFNDYFGLDIETDVYDTIGGWVSSQVGTPPKKNQRVLYGGYALIVDETDHLRISRIVVRKLPEQKEVVPFVS
jgi:CBS domain containing-hemolysin-like protein